MPPTKTKRTLAESDPNAQMLAAKKGTKASANAQQPLATVPANPTQKDRQDFICQLKATKAAAEEALVKNCLDSKARADVAVAGAVLEMIEGGKFWVCRIALRAGACGDGVWTVPAD